MKSFLSALCLFAALPVLAEEAKPASPANVGIGSKPIEGAEVLFDGTQKMLEEKWTYWQGPRFASSLPIKWPIVEDPIDGGTYLKTHDPAVGRGQYGVADIVTKKTFRDFRLHIEFYIAEAGGNSGVYLQNRYEIQIKDGDKTKHGMAAVINESVSPYELYKGIGHWNSYDIIFRAARFTDGKLTEKAMVSLYFNGQLVHHNVTINQVWGGANSGVDGGNNGGKGITDTPQGIKLQAEGLDVRFRNIWIKELNLDKPDTSFPQ